MKSKLKIGIIQTDIIWLARQKNINILEDKIASIEEADIVFLPEMFDTGFCTTPEELSILEPNTTLIWLKNIAKLYSIAIGGSLIIKENNNYYNRFVFVFPNGKIDFYNKRHLFGLAGERKQFVAGEKQKVVCFDNWKINLQICYDLRFPVWSRNKDDYHILTYVANWPTSRIKQWETLLMARAIENQCYTLGINRVGTDGNGFNYSGKSMIVSPKGDIIFQANDAKEQIYITELDFDLLQNLRAKFPILKDQDRFEISYTNTQLN